MSSYRPVPYHYVRPSPEEQLAGSRAFLDVISRRRTIRDFSSDPVPIELIENAILAASTAPSGANMQPWTFVVISDPATKRTIRLAAEEEERQSYEGRMAPEWLQALAPLGNDWHKPHLELAPYVIAVFEQPYRIVTGPDGAPHKVKHYYVRESVGIAVGFLLASLTHAGLATLTHTPSPMGFLNTILGRPANERAYVVIPVGYPSPDAVVPAIEKKPLGEVMVRIDTPLPPRELP
jgi:nitroreductase